MIYNSDEKHILFNINADHKIRLIKICVADALNENKYIHISN